MSLPSRGASCVGNAIRAAPVLMEIKQAQDGQKHGYQQALGEMRAGQKQTCWIWYIWPCLAPVRTTAKPQYSLPNFEATLAYLKDKVLCARLREITEVAVVHLNNGIKPGLLFGGLTDAHKFHESVTCFAITAAEARDHTLAKLFMTAVEAFDGKLEERVMDYIINECGFSKYHGIKTSQHFFDMLATCPKVHFHWNLVGPVAGGVTMFGQLQDKERLKCQAHSHFQQAADPRGSKLSHSHKSFLGA